MSLIMFDLVGRDDSRFSPWCWATRMALAHKGVEYEARATSFGALPQIPGGEVKSLPTIQHGDTVLADSLAIAVYLEEHFPERSLFCGPGGIAGAKFFQYWVGTSLVPQIARLILVDIHNHVLPEDRGYFRQSREKRFGESLEEVQSGREDRVGPFRDSLIAARLLLRKQPYLGGDEPLYMDYQLFGALQWARVTSDFSILEGDDLVMQWFGRCLDLHDKLGRTATGYWG